MASKITIEFRTGNSAVRTTDDIIEILRNVIYKIDNFGPELLTSVYTSCAIFDENGNRIGHIAGQKLLS